LQPPVIKDLVLVGGGHSHVAVLKAFGMRPLPGVRITLVSRGSATPYSGMLPDVVAGHHTLDEAHIDLAPLTRFAGARLVCGEVTGFDPGTQTVVLANRPPIAYDVLSINSGSTPALSAQALSHPASIAVKPIGQFLGRWQALLLRLTQHPGPARIAIVGGGAGGVELALAADHRLRALGIPASFELFTDTLDILPTHDARVRTRFRQILGTRNVAVHTQSRVIADADGRLRTEAGMELCSDVVLWVTEAAATPWIAASGIAVDERGFALVDECLRSVSHANVFASGDAAAMRDSPRPKSGVFAVRQGPYLAGNLRRALLGRRLRPYRPQRLALSLIGTGGNYAVASRGTHWAEGPWVWRWKQFVDRRFMRMYKTLPRMRQGTGRVPAALVCALPPELRATGLGGSDFSRDSMRCGGCGAKVGAQVLKAALDDLGVASRPDIVMGLAASDDAAAVEVPAGKLVVFSVDGFRPMLDDAYLFGKIAANHCLGDIFAVGAEPQTALALATLPLWPEAKLAAELHDMLAGAVEVLHANGAELVGGHTGEGAETSLGFTVTGFVDRDLLLPKRGLEPGQALVLTKPLGTGTILAAHMHARARGAWVEAAVATMLQSSREAVGVLRAHGAKACTDVTGFGLLGHLLEMIGDSPLDVALDLDALPLIEGALETLRAGFPSTLHKTNERATANTLIEDAVARHPRFALLCDPQTAGGLLAGVAPEQTGVCLAALAARGYVQSAVIGTVVMRSDGDRVRVVAHR
jgi:selenide,water dikinase